MAIIFICILESTEENVCKYSESNQFPIKNLHMHFKNRGSQFNALNLIKIQNINVSLVRS